MTPRPSSDIIPLPQWIVQAVQDIVTCALDAERADALTQSLIHPGSHGLLPSTDCARIVALAHVMRDTTPQSTQGARGWNIDAGRAALAQVEPLHKNIDADEWTQWTQAMRASIGSQQFQHILSAITPHGAGGEDVTQAMTGLINILVHGAHLNYDQVDVGARLLAKHALTGFFRPLMGVEDNWIHLGRLIPQCTMGSLRSTSPIYLNAVQAKKVALAAGKHYFQSVDMHNAYSFVLNEQQIDVADIVVQSSDKLLTLFEQYLSDDMRVPVMVRMEMMHQRIDALSTQLEKIAPEPAVAGWRKSRLELPGYAITDAIVAECEQMIVLGDGFAEQVSMTTPTRHGQRI